MTGPAAVQEALRRMRTGEAVRIYHAPTYIGSSVPSPGNEIRIYAEDNAEYFICPSDERTGLITKGVEVWVRDTFGGREADVFIAGIPKPAPVPVAPVVADPVVVAYGESVAEHAAQMIAAEIGVIDPLATPEAPITATEIQDRLAAVDTAFQVAADPLVRPFVEVTEKLIAKTPEEAAYNLAVYGSTIVIDPLAAPAPEKKLIDPLA